MRDYHGFSMNGEEKGKEMSFAGPRAQNDKNYPTKWTTSLCELCLFNVG